jgi:two-component system response regulator HydG
MAGRKCAHFLKDDAQVPRHRRGRISRENDLMSKARILIVHSEPSALTLLSSMLKSLGHEIDEAANDRVAVRLMERGGVDLMVAVADPTDVEALELLSYMRRKHRSVPVLLLFSSPMPERAKEALRQGALAVLRFPLPATELRAAVMQALAPRVGIAPPTAPTAGFCNASQNGFGAMGNGVPLGATVPVPAPAHLHGSPTPYQSFSNGSAAIAPLQVERVARELGIVGSDPSLRQAIELAGSIAPTRTPVLLVGEPGTGKSLLARMIHALGTRREQPMAVFDTAADTEIPAESERPREATNGRIDTETDWSSKLHQAHGGTMFINEVSSLNDKLQAQLLQALLERDVEASAQSGGAFDVRFILSSSENLPALVEQGKFRQDLYYRISIICMKLPPLRHRSADIEALAEYFRVTFSHEFGKNIVGFTHDALEALLKYDWPGNVHELKNVIRRGVILCQGARMTSGHLASSLSYPSTTRGGTLAGSRPHLSLAIRPLKEALEEPEKRIIIQALQALNWNRQETARVLDINRTTLYKKMKKYGLLVDGPIWVN